MRKLIGFIAAAAGILLVLQALSGKQEAIARARVEAAALRHERDSLIEVVQESERQRLGLAVERRAQEAAIAALLDSVATLERGRGEAQLTVREIRTTTAVMHRLRTVFPELGDSAWGLTTIPLEPGDTVGIEYLMVPAWFVETFLIDRANAQAWYEQKDRLLRVDSLRVTVATLQDSIARLSEAAASAYQAGYQSAYDSYGTLSTRYIAELRQPRIRLGSALGFILGAGTGVIAAELIR